MRDEFDSVSSFGPNNIDAWICWRATHRRLRWDGGSWSGCVVYRTRDSVRSSSKHRKAKMTRRLVRVVVVV